jgi:hypothetical protein
MSKRITLKRGEPFKKLHAFMKKQRNRDPKKSAKERQQRSGVRDAKLERLKVAQDVGPEVNSSPFGDYDDYAMEDTPSKNWLLSTYHLWPKENQIWL